MKKAFALLLTVTIIICMLPVGAWALTVSVNDDMPVTVNDEKYWITQEGKYAFEGSGNVQIVVVLSGDKKIELEMKGVNLSGSWSDEGALYIQKGNVLLNIVGKNSIKNVAMDASGVYIAEESSLTIIGDGELEVSGDAKDINNPSDTVNIERGYGYGVYNIGGSMNIESGTIRVIGTGVGTEEGRGYGVFNNLGSELTIKGGIVTVIGEGGGSGNGRGYGYGVWNRESTMKHESGMITATGMCTTTGDSFGVGNGIVNENGTLLINGGTIMANGIGIGYGNGIGIENSLGVMNIRNSEIMATGTGVGISNTGVMEIESGKVTATVIGESVEFGCGIHNTKNGQNIGTINIHGGVVEANGIGDETDGIKNIGILTVNNGTVTAIGTGKKADGIDNSGNLAVNNGTVTATGTGDEGNGINIWRGTMSANGGVVMARGESAGDEGNGIYNDGGKLSIHGGIVQVAGEGTNRKNVGNGICNFYGVIEIESGKMTAIGIGGSGNGIKNYVPINYIRFGSVSNESVLNIGGGTIKASGTGKDGQNGLFNDGGKVYIQGEGKHIYILENEKLLNGEDVQSKGELITSEMIYEVKKPMKAHFMVETKE